MLQGLGSVLEKRSAGQRSTWSAVMWAARDLLRVQAAHLLMWLLSPRQPVKMRAFAVHTLRSESRCKELLNTILHTHAQVSLQASVITNNKNNSMALVYERTILTEHRRLSAKLVPTFEDRGCSEVSATDPYSCILDFQSEATTISFK
jgi:hypothetical protein